MQDLNITLIQANLHWEDIEANLSHFTSLVENTDASTDLLILPEMFTTGFSVYPDKLAEGMDGRAMKWMLETAQSKEMAVVASFIHGDGNNYFNRLCWVMPDGSYQVYDKRHLFSMAGEQHRFKAGSQKLIVNYKGWKIRPLICYDLRFPVWSMNNYNNGVYDYDMLIYIASWPEVRAHIWKNLLQARVHENQCFVTGVNRVGEDGNGAWFSGDSMIIDPKGDILWQAVAGQEEIITANLRFSELEDFRNKFTMGLDWDKFEIFDD